MDTGVLRLSRRPRLLPHDHDVTETNRVRVTPQPDEDPVPTGAGPLDDLHRDEGGLSALERAPRDRDPDALRDVEDANPHRLSESGADRRDRWADGSDFCSSLSIGGVSRNLQRFSNYSGGIEQSLTDGACAISAFKRS